MDDFEEATQAFKKAKISPSISKMDQVVSLFEKGYSLGQETGPFLYQAALAWKELGQLTQELYDFQRSLYFFSLAAKKSLELEKTLFWHDYSTLLEELGRQTLNPSFFLEAIEKARTAGSSFAFAKASISLFRSTKDDEHLLQACEAIDYHLSLSSYHFSFLLFEKASLFKEHGIRRKDPALLKKGSSIILSILEEEQQPHHLFLAIELSFHSALIDDSLSHLDIARKLIADHKSTGLPLFHVAEGLIPLAEGIFTQKQSLVELSLSSFSKAISLNRTLVPAWNYLGLAFCYLYEFSEKSLFLTRALNCFEKSQLLLPSSETLLQKAVTLFKLAQHNLSEELLQKALQFFEKVFALERHNPFPQSDHLNDYALALDLMGNFKEEDSYHVQAIELLNRLLILDPSYPDIHYKLALCLSHLAYLRADSSAYQRSLVHFKLALRNQSSPCQLLLDWGLALIHFAELQEQTDQKKSLMREAEQKLFSSAHLGNPQAYYQLGCYYSLQGERQEALNWMKRALHLHAMPPLKEILEDAWLENLRSDEEFQKLLLQLALERHSS